jgi:hypothetical protein
MRLQSPVDLAFVVMGSLESARDCEKRRQHVELVTAKSMMTGKHFVVATIRHGRR